MMDLDAPLDFETEDLLLDPPTVNNKRKKVIGLDDLLNDHYEQKGKRIEKEKKRGKAKKNYDSDEDLSGREALISNIVNTCHHQMADMSGDEEIPGWGLEVFGFQQKSPSVDFPQLRSCMLLQSFTNNEVNSLVELTAEKGGTFLEGLLINGWLSKLVFTGGIVEKSIARWTFNLILYSSDEGLRTSSCDFWCAILSSKDKVDDLPVKIDWFPHFTDLKKALEIYGFSGDFSSPTESVDASTSCRGPPHNLIGWVKVTAACCKVRSKNSIFSTKEAEELVEVITLMFLDRQLLGLSLLLYECMESAISYFTDQEWNASCEKIAKSLACRVPADLNCLRLVDCISLLSNRSKHFRSTVAYHTLVICFDSKATSEEGLLDMLMSINLKNRNCDLFRMYIHLVLAENWLLSRLKLEEKPVISEMWSVLLRNCSCQISSTDLRPYAPKVRNKASFLLQGSARR